MRKAVLLSLVAAFGCLGFSYYERTRAELDLRKRVGELLANVHCNAQGLNQSQMRELEDLLLGHDFTFKPQSVRLSTAPTNNRPLDQICNQSKFAKHVLFYSYERPTVLLPFQTELHEARAEKLVEIPGTAPQIGTRTRTTGYSTQQSSSVQQHQTYEQVQQQRIREAQAQMTQVARQHRNYPTPKSYFPKPVDINKLNADLKKRMEKERKKRERDAKKQKKKKRKSATRWKNR